MRIDTYSFGHISVNGKSYSKDVMILPDGRVISPWYRGSGHVLGLSDLEEILESKPKILVIGTGNSGLMKPESRLTDTLEAKGIHPIVLTSQDAVEKFNQLVTGSEAVAACFHLTC